MALDPAAASGDLAGTPLLDEDYLILSTVHSAKGQEWEAVYLLNVSDGNFPNEFAAGKPEQIEEERRLLYVAMTRAKTSLELIAPLKRFPERGRHPAELLALGIRDYRETFFKPYRIIYYADGKRVYVSLIADGRRDMQALLARRLLAAYEGPAYAEALRVLGTGAAERDRRIVEAAD